MIDIYWLGNINNCGCCCWWNWKSSREERVRFSCCCHAVYVSAISYSDSCCSYIYIFSMIWTGFSIVKNSSLQKFWILPRLLHSIWFIVCFIYTSRPRKWSKILLHLLFACSCYSPLGLTTQGNLLKAGYYQYGHNIQQIRPAWFSCATRRCKLLRQLQLILRIIHWELKITFLRLLLEKVKNIWTYICYLFLFSCLLIDIACPNCLWRIVCGENSVQICFVQFYFNPFVFYFACEV